MFEINEMLMHLVRHNLENGEVPILLGKCGIDKPAWAEMLADSMDTKCFTLSCRQLWQLMETPGLANSEPIRNACDYAAANPQKLSILFLDEMEQMTPCTVFAALSILTGRQIGYAKFPDSLRTMASACSKESLVCSGLNSAIIRQFVLYSVESD